jgi:integrase/recombinase XerD
MIESETLIENLPARSVENISIDRVGISERDLNQKVIEAKEAWLTKSPSLATRENYTRDLRQFCEFAEVPEKQLGRILQVRPTAIAAWRVTLLQKGMTNSSVCRKMTVLRSFFSYLQTYGYTGINPAHSDFVKAPSVPRDGKTVGLSSDECRRLLDAPRKDHRKGIRDRAIMSILAYSACRVGELVRLRVGDYKSSGGHKVLEIRGKGGKERRVPLHPEAFERLDAWIAAAEIGDDKGPLFRPQTTARGNGQKGFQPRTMTRRSVQRLIKSYARTLGLDPRVTVHSFRVTALTTARERGSDIIDLQDFAGHSDPRTTLTYIRNRDRMSNSPAYVLRY